MITRYLADLLFQQECVIVPGLGGFIKAYRPAQIIHAKHEFSPPSGTVAFNAGLAGNDGQLASYIASIENTSYREALYEIKIWVEKCYETINEGHRISLEGIGELFLNSSGKLEFIPSMQINFNADSFGLPVFYSKSADRTTFNIPEVHITPHANRNAKFHRLIPETVKWAAVLAPFIAFALWGSLNGNIIDNYVHNYTGMYSWVRSTPGKTAPLKKVSSPVKAQEVVVEVIHSPSEVLLSQNKSFDPAMVSYAALAKQQISIVTSSQPIIPENIAAAGENYFIIGGAFRDHDNAIKLIGTLRDEGFPASIADTTPSGLYVVSMKGFIDYNRAVIELDEIKKAGFASSWILKKQRS